MDVCVIMSDSEGEFGAEEDRRIQLCLIVHLYMLLIWRYA